MKKLLNNPSEVVKDMFDGLALCHPDRMERVGGLVSVFRRRGAPVKGRVGLVLGGGSGHEPMFIGYLGPGLADVVVQGGVFASPTPDLILAAAQAADSGAGVLFIYGNYAGDILNFDMAEELCRDEGLKVKSVRTWDDISTGPDRSRRRGVTADVYTIKAAGAAAAEGLDLDGVERAARLAMENSRTLGVCLTPATLPETGLATFELGDDEMEIGMGAHGEAGIKRDKMRPASELAEFMIGKLCEDFPLRSGDEVVLMANGMGATTLMELYIMAAASHRALKKRGVEIFASDVGELMTTQEMGGCHLTLMKLDEELKRYWLAPCSSLAYNRHAPGWTV
ncbi:MAG: dihydroxyacetone kinase subunit DhaK [Deltaproteobacteria bacterium]|jgi:dihydroxyacetone kinase-like protein|nr:dihydroxyacetone kinase subunit DhaK [Deltaproteobacteria bacterium]